MDTMKHISHTLSNPIPIKEVSNINKQYGIKNNCFYPVQNSPPSIWKIRLNKRLGDNQINHQYKNNT
jgi:hypothetical protein